MVKVPMIDRIIPTEHNIHRGIVQEHIQRYIFAANYVRDKVVLDVACGVGYGSYYLAKMGAKVVYGLDISKTAITLSLKYYKLPNTEYIIGDALKMPFKDSLFDVVISFETIEHLHDPEKFIYEVKRVLKKNGIFICSTPNIKYTGNPDFHIHEFSPEEFWRFMEKHFSLVKKFGQYYSKLRYIKERISYFLDSLFPSRCYYDTRILPLKIDTIKRKLNYKVVPLNSSGGILKVMVAVCQK